METYCSLRESEPVRIWPPPLTIIFFFAFWAASSRNQASPVKYFSQSTCSHGLFSSRDLPTAVLFFTHHGSYQEHTRLLLRSIPWYKPPPGLQKCSNVITPSHPGSFLETGNFPMVSVGGPRRRIWVESISLIEDNSLLIPDSFHGFS